MIMDDVIARDSRGAETECQHNFDNLETILIARNTCCLVNSMNQEISGHQIPGEPHGFQNDWNPG
jgi:hypothetical protein